MISHEGAIGLLKKYKVNEGIVDKKDVPFLSCALAFDCPIWSDEALLNK